MGTYNYKMFNFFNRKFAITEQGPPSDVKDAFSEFSDGDSSMTADQFRRLLVEHQGEVDGTDSDLDRIVEEVFQSLKLKQDGDTTTSNSDEVQHTGQGLSLDEFFQFLFLDDFNGPLKSQVHHDMNAPLSHYFIYTGHNSYLTGNQLSSDCSDVPIIKALQRGVRVIELDLWPNSTKDDIVVVHGRTLTTPVSLIQCLKSIKEYAFVKSHYPVIITLEDHLTPDLQAKVAEMATQIFGELLYYPQTEAMMEFPTPESLKGRILISTKPPKEYLEVKQIKDAADNERESTEEGLPSPDLITELEGDDRVSKETCDDSGSKETCDDNVNKETCDDSMSKETCDDSMSKETGDDRHNGSDQDEEDLNAHGRKSDQQGALEYKRLITIHAGKPKGHVKDDLKVVGGVRRLSLSEQILEKASVSYGADIVRYTQKNIIRVYPKGTRVTSSNYRPHIGWMYGAQMVAFNMQGHGKSLWFMQGMFRANGGCGYVKKPSFLMEGGPHDEVFDPKRILPVKKTLKVKVYMGNGWSSDFSKTHFDTFSPPDFYSKVCIVGVPADKAKKKTRIIHDDWFPVWDEEFDFPLTVPELALLRIEVGEYDKHERDDFGGQTCLPISELRPGFRSVPLYDERGEKLKSVRLLMRFQFT